MRCSKLILIGIGFVAAGSAQPNRESYHVPYQAWRQTSPSLETDAGAPTPTFADQLRASAQAAQTFFSAKAAYMALAQPSAVDQTAWASRPLATAETLLSTPQNVDQLLAVRAARVGTEINSFKADDKDPAIRRVRQAMERERAALRALIDTLAARKAPLTELIDRSDEAEIQRASVFQTLNAANGRRTQLTEHVKREATAWSKYYTDFLEGATGGRTSSTSSVNTPAAAAAAPGTPLPAAAKIVRPANGQIPISRYTGKWSFPSKGLYYGPQPESIEMAIEESDGLMRGALSAKFIKPARTLTFEFQGPVVQGRSQAFALKTGDGIMGRIELIPGSAINLLEVNFQADSTAGNFILVKQ